MDNDTKLLMDILYKKCSKKDNSNYIFYYITDILTKFGIINLDINNIENFSNNKLDIIKYNPSIPNDISSLVIQRYTKDFNEISKIGEGGFGKVYLAKNIIDLNFYAIKKICVKYKEGFNIDSALNEIRILSKLNHLNIIKYNTAWIEPIIYPLSDISNNSSCNLLESYSNNSIEYDSNNSISNSLIEFKDSSNELPIKNYDKINQLSQEVFNESSYETSYESSNETSSENSLKLCNSEKSNNLYINIYIQMEYCSGLNLRDYLDKRKNININDNFKILKGVIDGVEYLHKNNIIHRDLKPSNIFLDNNYNVKIGDFGLSTTELDLYLKKSYGTYLYLDPLIRDLGKTCDFSMDIYSIGIIIIELFTIFKTNMERFEILKDPLPYLKSNENYLKKINVNNKIFNLTDIISSCLNSNINNRYNIYNLVNI